MKIHPLWFFCIFIRLSIIVILWLFNKKFSKQHNKKMIKITCCIFLMIIGFGFLNKAYFGSNNEKQIAKVFWHETRYIHGIIYLLSSLYLLNDNLNLCLLLLLLDVIFSVLFRIILKI